MKINKYRILSAICYLFIFGLSLSFSFFGDIKGNYLYLVIKCIALLWLLVKFVAVFFPKTCFSGAFPTTITCLIMQFVPLLSRIGFKSEGATHIIMIYICSFITFILLATSLLFAFSNQDYRKHENNVPRSTKIN